jgi:hypothetical protein
LGKYHAEKLVEAGKTSYAPVALITLDAFVEIVFGQKVEQLRKDQSSREHKIPLSPSKWGKDEREPNPI